jgi:hypothetical protein
LPLRCGDRPVEKYSDARKPSIDTMPLTIAASTRWPRPVSSRARIALTTPNAQ